MPVTTPWRSGTANRRTVPAASTCATPDGRLRCANQIPPAASGASADGYSSRVSAITDGVPSGASRTSRRQAGSAIHTAPSAAARISVNDPSSRHAGSVSGAFVTAPCGVMRNSVFVRPSAAHSVPSGPVAPMSGTSSPSSVWLTVPAVSERSSEHPPANHAWPSGPSAAPSPNTGPSVAARRKRLSALARPTASSHSPGSFSSNELVERSMCTQAPPSGLVTSAPNALPNPRRATSTGAAGGAAASRPAPRR